MSVPDRKINAIPEETVKEFKNRHPGSKIGFSSFASLRPKRCVLPDVKKIYYFSDGAAEEQEEFCQYILSHDGLSGRS
ncbi:hypothetical protein ANN_09527 [Periplaneta americana]|uniref:Uncharacterized protein n=1 Tax=Periplaneta americana TaxID=6978 RepID=A0ABQ8TLL4_PERAM|nr:hypothetical protein ANN_09527 [Periplaneta americana]